MPLVVSPPPPTPIEPVTDVLHGVPITDPYRWLEDQNSPRTRKWLEEQAAYSRAYLDSLPGRTRIRKRVEALLAVETISEPWKVGNRYFYLKRKAYEEQATIMMREGDAGEEIVLVNPAGRAERSATAIGILNISRDGNLLAYGVRQGGQHSQAIEFFDIDRMQVIPDRLPPGFCYGLVFSADGRGFYYSHELSSSMRPNYRTTYWHEFGSNRQEDSEIFVAGEDPKLHLALFGSTDGRYLWHFVVQIRDSLTFHLYMQDLVHEMPARKILEQTGSVFELFFMGHRLFALTDLKAPNRRIVAIDPEHPESEHWVDVVRESRRRIKDYAIVGNFICAGYVKNLSSQIEVFDLSGLRQGMVPCPPQGTARLLRRALESDTLFYEFSSFDHPPTIFSYQATTQQHKQWAKCQVKIPCPSIEVERVRYESKDGTQIPMFLASAKGQGQFRPSPIFLTGYGGFGSSRTPQFNAYSAFLLECGFLFAVANIRGGGELGARWHREGKRWRRQDSIDDFIAAAEWLSRNGYAAPGQIAIGGGSNGGLLVGAAVTQRPDLFRVAICVGPLLDMLRYHLFDAASYCIDEYGSSEDQNDFQHLIAYSPYHRVTDGIAYPSVLLVSGDADTCCNPMHVRKMAARLQVATRSNNPILLDYKPTWGHVPTQPLSQRIEALTDRLAFLCHEVGVSTI